MIICIESNLLYPVNVYHQDIKFGAFITTKLGYLSLNSHLF